MNLHNYNEVLGNNILTSIIATLNVENKFCQTLGLSL